MASTTGIELGRDTCLLAGVRPARAGGAEVFALHRIAAGDWPAHDEAISDALRTVRRAKRLPRRASVVAWGLPDGAVDDEISRSALRPVEAAGFRIASILTPPQALARLAATRPRNSPSEAVAWLALNTYGVAIAIVCGSELLFSRTFQWRYDPNLASGKAQLLQRYTLIAHLAPELRRGMDAVRQSHGLPVEAVVTCGDLPELRSLTMPLIEELDLEVETLDSTEGLHAGRATLDRFADQAPALRLAVAAALAPTGRSPRASTFPAAMRIAAAVALIAALAWGTYSYWNVSPVRTARPTSLPRQAAVVRPPARSPAPALPPDPKLSSAAPAEPKALPTAGRREPQPVPPSLAKRESKPAPPPARGNPEPKAPSLTTAESKLSPALTRPEPKPPPPRPSSSSIGPTTAPAPPLAQNDPPPVEQSSAERRAPLPVPSSTVNRSSEQPMPLSADARSNLSPSPAALTPDTRQTPLKEPLPKVDSILIDQDRRLALIDGAIVGVGDSVGGRVVVQIDRDSVVLREPSGRIVRVRLRAPVINH